MVAGCSDVAGVHFKATPNMKALRYVCSAAAVALQLVVRSPTFREAACLGIGVMMLMMMMAVYVVTVNGVCIVKCNRHPFNTSRGLQFPQQGWGLLLLTS